MKILFLAPQPFYGERGTPIAVDLALKVLSERGDPIDVLTYHLGKEMAYPNVAIHRIPNLPFVRSVAPGFSPAKLVCDFFLFFKALAMARRGGYGLVHAVEESVFVAMLLKLVFRIPYLYDMDSSLAQQMVEKHRFLAPLSRLMAYLEGRAVKAAKAVVPVCDALRLDIEKYRPARVVVLWDVSLLENEQVQTQQNVRAGLQPGDQLVMYVGNLEAYQGIDLLLESFALAVVQNPGLHLAIVGGKPEDIEIYREKAQRLALNGVVRFLGPKPVGQLSAYLSQADLLVSPRTKGRNTPMKLYSYLGSGKPVLATNLSTHTQVLDESVACLAEPTPEAFAAGLLRLSGDAGLRERLGQGGQKLIAERHTFQVFREKLNVLYDWIEAQVAPAPAGVPETTARANVGLVPPSAAQMQGLRIHYQPIVSLESGQISGFEALLRWHDPERGLLSPAELLQDAERSGQIVPIGRWVLQEACRQLKEWKSHYPASLPLTISVNLSAQQLRQPDLIELIDQVLEETGLDTQSLRLEVSDEDLAAETGPTSETVLQLQARGVQFLIDYYRAADASLDLQPGLAASALKINRALVSRMAAGGVDTERIQQVVTLARNAGMEVVAVGVETSEDLARLKALQVEQGQGYFFSQPLGGESAEALMSAAPPWQGRFFIIPDPGQAEDKPAQPAQIGAGPPLAG